MRLTKEWPGMFLKVICVGRDLFLIVLDEHASRLSHEKDILSRSNLEALAIKMHVGENLCHWSIHIVLQKKWNHGLVLDRHLVDFNVAYVSCSRVGSHKSCAYYLYQDVRYAYIDKACAIFFSSCLRVAQQNLIRACERRFVSHSCVSILTILSGFIAWTGKIGFSSNWNAYYMQSGSAAHSRLSSSFSLCTEQCWSRPSVITMH